LPQQPLLAASTSASMLPTHSPRKSCRQLAPGPPRSTPNATTLQASVASSASSATTTWKFSPPQGFPLAIRKEPKIDSEMTVHVLNPWEIFQVSQELPDKQTHITFLKLADGRGWVFDAKPGAGRLCTRVDQAQQGPVHQKTAKSRQHNGHYRCDRHGYCMISGRGEFENREDLKHWRCACTHSAHCGVGCLICSPEEHHWSCCGGAFDSECTAKAVAFTPRVQLSAPPQVLRPVYQKQRC